MYRRLTVRLTDGTAAKLRVNRTLWDSVSVGNTLVKAAGQDPVKK